MPFSRNSLIYNIGASSSLYYQKTFAQYVKRNTTRKNEKGLEAKIGSR